MIIQRLYNIGVNYLFFILIGYESLELIPWLTKETTKLGPVAHRSILCHWLFGIRLIFKLRLSNQKFDETSNLISWWKGNHTPQRSSTISRAKI